MTPEPRDLNLDSIERWLLAVVTHPDGAEGGLRCGEAMALAPQAVDDAESMVTRSASLTAMERLEVYANMYYWRLVDVMYEDLRATHRALGADEYVRLARAYLHAHPSRTYRLGLLSRGFADFLAEEAEEVPHRRFVAELARLERALEEVFSEEHEDPITTKELEAVPPDAWPGAVFLFVPALRLLSFEYPVNAYYQAHLDDEEPSIPDPEKSRVLVYRSEQSVWRSELSLPQFVVLSRLCGGDSFGEALEACTLLPGVDVEAIIADIGSWFRKWAGLGLISRIDV